MYTLNILERYGKLAVNNDTIVSTAPTTKRMIKSMAETRTHFFGSGRVWIGKRIGDYGGCDRNLARIRDHG